jgi:hypothetical protein
MIKSLHQSSKYAACGEWLIAPQQSTYAEQVDNLWFCPKCGNEFETSIYLTREVPLTPEIVDTFFPGFVGCVRGAPRKAHCVAV